MKLLFSVAMKDFEMQPAVETEHTADCVLTKTAWRGGLCAGFECSCKPMPPASVGVEKGA